MTSLIAVSYILTLVWVFARVTFSPRRTYSGYAVMVGVFCGLVLAIRALV